MNNINTPAGHSEELTWEAPVLYKEEWLNTLSGGAPGPEVIGPDPS